ncbi:DUF2147 domain-containing protein [Microbaculum marinum]|uniref:DUF2147 domain-containing protein n=1 Tax=Microbaculum marinum TaxID=1764581 RepID=A0AAW9RW66_9HYPH
MGFRTLSKLLSGLAMLAVVSAGPASADPSGTWLTENGDARVQISKCSNSYCGTIVWEKTPRTDTRNPDPAKRDRPLVGVQMIYGMVPDGENQYSGKLYNPRDGKTYTGKLTMQGAETMKLAGCVLGGLICKSETWTRSN